MHHAEVQRFPNCPAEGCHHELTEAELERLFGETSQLLSRFRQDVLNRAIDGLGGVVHCPNPACASAVITEPRDGRQRWECTCGWPAWCTSCRQPYHYHVDCSMVQPLRERWLRWVCSDRASYHLLNEQSEIYEGQRRALEDAMTRHAELHRDEAWKAANCRVCPRCLRPVQKIEGCDSMVCGGDAHGGNIQPGCGHRFSWQVAQPYRAMLESRPLPPLDVAEVRLRGAGLVHPFCRCRLCDNEISGPRFRCIHCPDFNLRKAYTFDRNSC